MATAKNVDSGEISVLEVVQGQITVCILGTTPMINNRMSQKVWMELLAPKGKKTAADKASTMKHDPIQEFRDSPYMMPAGKPTALGILPTAFKRAIGTAALDMPGARKSQMMRLIEVPAEMTGIYGLPEVFMAITRSADINHTPDVRTRAILPEWCCELSIKYTKPMLREQTIANLLAAAGFQCGVGDWRQEKGSGSYGAFKLVDANNPDFQRIKKTQGREAQLDALKNPVAHNDETNEMLAWFDVEIRRRGFKVAA